MITREEARLEIWDNKSLGTLSKVFCDDLVKKLFAQQDQLQAIIEDLEHNYKVQVDNGHIAYKNYKNMVGALQATIEAQEIIIKDKSAIIEAMAHDKSCKSCKKVNECDMAQKSKDTFGTKLYEQWFICYEPNEQP